MNLAEIFLVFLKIGCLAIGGAYASISIIENEVVHVSKWMSYEDFGNLLAIDELTPGPIMINCATFIGMTMSGFPGALAASIGCIVPACIVSTILILIYRKYRKLTVLDNIVFSLKAMALAMIISTLVNIVFRALFPEGIISLSNFDYLIAVLAVASFIIISKIKVNPVFVMLGCGTIYTLFHLFILK